MKLKEAMNLNYNDINKMNRKELADVIKTLGRTVNYRVKTLMENKEGRYSPALHSLERSLPKGTDMSSYKVKTRGKDINQLRSDFKRYFNFINLKTSKVGGVLKVRKTVEQRLGVKFTEEESTSFWELYRKGVERYASKLKNVDSNTVQKYLASNYDKGKIHSSRGFLISMNYKIRELYEEDVESEEDLNYREI